MKAFANLSIRNKLIGIILIATLVPLTVGFYVVLRESRRAFEDQLKESTLVMARLMGAYTAIALDFEVRDLTGLKDFDGVPYITAAIVYDNQDEEFDSYNRDDGPLDRPDFVYREDKVEIQGNYVNAFVPIFHTESDLGEERLGTFFLRSTTEHYLERQRAFAATMGWLLGGLVMVTVLLAWGLQRVISKPILELAEAARQISNQANYSLRVEKPGQDEIGQLYDGFNAMLTQIEKRQSELERSNRDLDQFAYVASHDLKEPLRAIANLSSWLHEDHGDELGPEAQEKLSMMRERVQRMDAMIGGILKYSRLGRSDSAGEPVDVGKLLRDLIELIDKPEGMTIAITTPMPSLITRPLRLQQVFANLITNAIRYHDHPGHGRIEIAASAHAEELYTFTVADDGPGIAPEHHEKIFMMFQTADNHHPGSTGLGLSLVKKLVEDEGGSIELRSARGVGATFSFTWPPTSPAA